MTYGIVQTNVLDLWAKPEFNSERVNQALFGEVLKVGSCRKGYVRVVQTDGYTSWTDRRFLSEIRHSDYHRWLRSCNHVVKSSTARLYDKRQGSLSPYFVFYGTRLAIGRTSGGLAYLLCPIGGPQLYVKSSHLVPIKATMQPVATGSAVVREARRFLGVPYLWGGITPAGFDCSGLVRAVYGRFGVSLPRDTRDQIKVGRRVARSEIKTGDLVFFDRHVGLAIGGTRLIHASVGGGGVRENSFSPSEENFREDLDRSYRIARRVL